MGWGAPSTTQCPVLTPGRRWIGCVCFRLPPRPEVNRCPLMLCGEWPVRQSGSLVATSFAPLSLGGCSDIEVLRCLSASKRAGRINAWRSSDKLNHLRELGSAEVSRDLLNASLMEQ